MQPDDFAALVVSTVKTALAPYAERLAKAEATVARISELTELRDRVTAIEVKQGIQLPPDPAIADLRTRLLLVETKAQEPRQEPPQATLSVIPDESLSALRDRVVALETRQAMPPAADAAVADLRERLVGLEKRLTDDGTAKEITSLRERIAVLETRAAVPGPPGKDGKDGTDGLGFDDVVVEQKDDRHVVVKYARGERVKEAGTFALPAVLYRGVYVEGKEYERGDTVTWAGAMWHCNEVTREKPGDGAKAWTLAVKRGRDGKDGKDGAPAPLPVVSVGGVK